MLPPPPRKKYSVLLIDDDESSAFVIGENLRADGYDVTTVPTGFAGMESLKTTHYDLLITGLILPDISGIQVVREAIKTNPQIPVIVLTNYNTLDSAIEALEAGASDFLLKPCGRIELSKKAKACLDNLDLRNQVEQVQALAAAVEEGASSVVITDREGIIQYINPAFVKITGYSLQDAVGKTPRILKSGFHPPQFYEKLWETLLSGGIWRGEFRNRAKSGKIIYEFQTIRAIKNNAGEITHFVSVKVDDTERKHEALRLRKYVENLERSNRDLAEFAAVAAHDLQEPARKIEQFGSRLAQSAANLGDREKDYLDRMRQAGKRMQNFIRELLDYSKIGTESRPMENVDIGQILREVVSDLDARIEESHGSVELRNLPVLEADALQMRQLFQNLLGNALKYRKPDVPPKVVVDSRRMDNGFWEITVADNGIGFDEKHIERIFRPFERLHGKSQYEGHGMGLAVCRGIVSRHDGVISARSIPGVGATFIIHIPAIHPKVGTLAAES